jgi:ankyrin repeat protein
LHAADHKDSYTVSVVLSAGAPVDAAAADGRTALVLAASAGDVDSVRVLLSARAAVDAAATHAGAPAKFAQAV